MRRKNKKLWMVLSIAALLVLASVAGSVQALSNGVVLSDAEPVLTGLAASSTPATTDTKSVFLHVGSPLLLDQDAIVFLDPEQFDVTATLINNRTLVPLRVLSEYFGATVSYDATKKTAMISYGDKKFEFPIGSKNYYLTEGNTKITVSMDTSALLINNRTMVPLRVVAEDLLGKEVAYRSGAIAISDQPIDFVKQDSLYRDVKSKIGTAVKAQSLYQLKNLIAAQASQDGTDQYREEAAVTAMPSALDSNAKTESAATADSSAQAASGAGSSDGFSQTNIQVSGIDEADIVKTDGKYLYIAGNNAVRIVRTEGEKLYDTATIKLPDDRYVQEIYLDDNRLILVGNRQESSYLPGDPGIPMPLVRESGDISISSDAKMAMSILPYYYKSFSFVDVYDITNPEQPTYIKGHEMEGSYQTSRKQDGIVYLITNAYSSGDLVVPMMKDTTVSGQSYSIKINDVMIMPDYFVPGYVILSAVDTLGDQKTQVEAITASGQLTYMSENALYLASSDYNGVTAIAKFKIDGMTIGYAGTGKVKGYLLNQFSMDEYEDHLRVATTTWGEDNALYVLDASMNVTGSVTSIAKGEQIYSVRFMGEKGYVVTFRTMDPLFVFDLSDPTAPKITGELKIPGFSNYLQPVGEDLILGIGAETKELYEKDQNGELIVVGTRQGGIKLSLFDVSDMGKPREITNLVVGTDGSYSEAFYNHKAVMMDPATGQVAFDASIVKDVKTWESKQGALVISYKDKTLQLRGILDYTQPEIYGGKYIPYGRRTAFIGDTLYYIQDGVVNSYNYDTLQKMESLVLK